MAFVEYEADGIEEVRRMMTRLEKDMPKRAAQIVNTATRDSRSEGSKAIREITTLKAQAVNNRLQFTKRATARRPAGRILVSAKAIQLRFFKAKGGTQSAAGSRRRQRRPVIAEIERGQPFEIEGAFQQRNSRARFLIRATDFSGFVSRYPIRAVVGPSLITIMENNPSIFQRMRRRAEEVMTRETLKEIDKLTR